MNGYFGQAHCRGLNHRREVSKLREAVGFGSWGYCQREKELQVTQ
jgi:hypothetical protein